MPDAQDADALDADRPDADALDAGAPVRTTAGDAFSELVVRLFQLNGLLADAGDAITRPVGQTTARWQVLASVEHEGRSVASIARTLGLARQSVQRVADALEASGFITYETNPRHRRAQLVVLTDQGIATLRAIQAAQSPWADAVGQAVGEKHLRQASAVLQRVAAALAVTSARR